MVQPSRRERAAAAMRLEKATQRQAGAGRGTGHRTLGSSNKRMADGVQIYWFNCAIGVFLVLALLGWAAAMADITGWRETRRRRKSKRANPQ